MNLYEKKEKKIVFFVCIGFIGLKNVKHIWLGGKMYIMMVFRLTKGK